MRACVRVHVRARRMCVLLFLCLVQVPIRAFPTLPLSPFLKLGLFVQYQILGMLAFPLPKLRRVCMQYCTRRTR